MAKWPSFILILIEIDILSRIFMVDYKCRFYQLKVKIYCIFFGNTYDSFVFCGGEINLWGKL